MACEYLSAIPVLYGETAMKFIHDAENVKPITLSAKEKELIAEIKKYSFPDKGHGAEG
jgi:hypothetical protein